MPQIPASMDGIPLTRPKINPALISVGSPVPLPADLLTRPLSYYLSLITSEHQGSPKFLAWVTALLQPFIDVAHCANTMFAAFDLDQAVGAQLDILGKLIGQSRTVPFVPSNGVSPVLDDFTYRILLKAQRVLNTWNGQAGSFEAQWAQIFTGGTIRIQDNLNMTMTVTLTGIFPSIVMDLIQNGFIVPRPQGVGINYVFGSAPYFGFDANNSYVGGFDSGYWS